jgi:hypothetical protein
MRIVWAMYMGKLDVLCEEMVRTIQPARNMTLELNRKKVTRQKRYRLWKCWLKGFRLEEGGLFFAKVLTNFEKCACIAKWRRGRQKRWEVFGWDDMGRCPKETTFLQNEELR